MNGLESQVPRSALSQMVTRRVSLGDYMFFACGPIIQCGVCIVHREQWAMERRHLPVKQELTVDAGLWPNLLKIAMYKDGWIIAQMVHIWCCHESCS